MNIEGMTDIEVLAMTAYGENRGGGTPGMQSVLNVIMNRVATPGWWGYNPRNVCLKPQQFSCWNPDDPNYKVILAVNSTDPVYADALDLATSALDRTLPDITNNATYYQADGCDAYWARGLEPCAIIANQRFYNNVP